MSSKRKRIKQTTTLEERLSRFTTQLQSEAKSCEPNSEEALNLQRRIRKTEAARRFNISLNSGK